MRDSYSEYMVKKKKTGKDIFFRVGAIVLALFLTYILLGVFVSSVILEPFALVGILGLWYGVYWVFAYTNVEYEYIVTNGEIDVDKIIAKRKRQRMLSIRRPQIEAITTADHPTHKHLGEQNIGGVVNATSGKKDAPVYLVVFTSDKMRGKLLFEPNEKMVGIFKQFIPGKVLL